MNHGWFSRVCRMRAVGQNIPYVHPRISGCLSHDKLERERTRGGGGLRIWKGWGKLSGILANRNSVEFSAFQGIGFQTYLIIFTSLVMSNLLVFVSFFDMLKKNVMYLSLIPSFGSFIQLLSVSFPSPPTSSLWVKDNWYLLFYLFLRLCPVLA